VPRRLAVAIGGLLSVAIVAATGSPVAATSRTAAPGPSGGTLAWHGCGGGFQCATLSVPVDWTQPAGAQVSLAIARHPATSGPKLGTLVINYGGPGDPGAETLRQGGLQGMPKEIRQRFDVVSFDPRGTGTSRPVACVPDATYDAELAGPPTPKTPEDEQRFYAGTNGPVDLVQACVNAQGQWLADVGTRNTARDLEALRAALGAPKLTFLGYSYGTVIGAVYAQMYPAHVDKLVLDGAVNLSSSAESELHDNAVGFEQALDAFLADCAAHPSCAFHHNGNPRAALTDVQQRFEGGLELPVTDGRKAGATLFYLALAAALYDRATGWPFLAHALSDAEHGTGDGLAQLSDSLTGRDQNGHFNDIQEALAAIKCDDRHDPLVSFPSYLQTFQQYSQQFPIFGGFLTASPLGCDPRMPAPAPGEQVGDVRVTGAPPILIVGTTGDPATPYNGALDLQQRLQGSRLLTLVSTEHAGYAKGIHCIDDAVDAYLVSHALPKVGTRCKP
jgi:pimeloyl-ACP methyl ester carboxylesterase